MQIAFGRVRRKTSPASVFMETGFPPLPEGRVSSPKIR